MGSDLENFSYKAIMLSFAIIERYFSLIGCKNFRGIIPNLAVSLKQLKFSRSDPEDPMISSWNKSIKNIEMLYIFQLSMEKIRLIDKSSDS